MPLDEKNSRASLDVYTLDVRNGRVELKQTGSISDVNAAFRYMNQEFEMLVLTGIALDGGIAIVDYSEGMDRISVFYVSEDGERIAEAVELGEFIDGAVLESLREKIGAMLFRHQNPGVFVVSGYENVDPEGTTKVTKLLPTGAVVQIF
jgi:hypothetical protein